MKIPDYIILTPTAPFKLYSLDRFLKNALSFNPKPKEMVFCLEPEIKRKIAEWRNKLKSKKIKLVILELEPEIVKKYPACDKRKLTFAREKLRKYFLKSPYDWAPWLDCDIMPEKEVAKKLLKIALSEKYIAVNNGYLSRFSDGLKIFGIGCTMTHRIACELAKFFIAPLKDFKGKTIKELCDDFWFLGMLSLVNRMIEKLLGWHGLKRGIFVKTIHLNERGEERVLTPEGKKN